MIEINQKNTTYICPFCRCRQSYNHSSTSHYTGYEYNYGHNKRTNKQKEADFSIIHLECTNPECNEISVIAFNGETQTDLIPEFTYKHFPKYIPEQILSDYIEGVSVIARSPKAAATMFRRCLQGMIRDFWSIKEKRLLDEILKLEGKVSPGQWKAIDGVRRIGNIGAHMEQDVNIIIDVDPFEAEQLQKLIEFLLAKWYIERHEAEELSNSIAAIAEEKEKQKKGNNEKPTSK